MLYYLICIFVVILIAQSLGPKMFFGILFSGVILIGGILLYLSSPETFHEGISVLFYMAGFIFVFIVVISYIKDRSLAKDARVKVKIAEKASNERIRKDWFRNNEEEAYNLAINLIKGRSEVSVHYLHKKLNLIPDDALQIIKRLEKDGFLRQVHADIWETTNTD